MEVKILVEQDLINWFLGKNGCTNQGSCFDETFLRYKTFFKNNIKNKDIVLLSFARSRVVNKRKMSYPRNPSKSKIAIFEERLNLFSDAVLALNANIYLVDDIPVYCEPAINFEHFYRLQKLEICNVREANF